MSQQAAPLAFRNAFVAKCIDSGILIVYNQAMNLVKLSTLLYLAHALSGCAVYMGASAVSQIGTGKSIPEHAVSTVTQADCSIWDWATDNSRHNYYCEVRDISRTYNRNTF